MCKKWTSQSVSASLLWEMWKPKGPEHTDSGFDDVNMLEFHCTAFYWEFTHNENIFLGHRHKHGIKPTLEPLHDEG